MLFKGPSICLQFVLYLCENKKVQSKRRSLILKGQFNKIFVPHFCSFEPAWATDQWVKIFSILVKILPGYSTFFRNLLRVLYTGESISLGVCDPGESTANS